MISGEQYDVLFQVALNLTIDQWLDGDEPKDGYEYEQNVKCAADALHNVWTDNIRIASVWSERALKRLRGK